MSGAPRTSGRPVLRLDGDGDQEVTFTVRIVGYGKPAQIEEECAKTLRRILLLEFGDRYELTLGAQRRSLLKRLRK